MPSNWAAPHNGPAKGQEDQEGAPWLIPPAKPKTGFSPLLCKQARHISQALTSGTMRKLLIKVAQLTDDTHRNKAQTRVDGDRSSAHNDWVNGHSGGHKLNDAASNSLSYHAVQPALPTAQTHTPCHIHLRVTVLHENHQKKLTPNTTGWDTEHLQRASSASRLHLICTSGQLNTRLLRCPN